MFSIRRNRGFSQVEILIVLGLILLLMALLLPALAKAREQSNSLKCKSNLRQLGLILLMYVNDNRGWMFPVGPDGPDGKPTVLGMNVPPNLRWPMQVKGLPFHPPDVLPFDPNQYDPHAPDSFPAGPFTPPILVCPSETDPVEAHSYVLNQHLADKRITFGKRSFRGLSPSEVVVAGEKRVSQRDYYMERFEFDRVVEKYKHGAKNGSNYLFFDGHVDTAPPRQILDGLDPWDVPLPPSSAPSQ